MDAAIGMLIAWLGALGGDFANLFKNVFYAVNWYVVSRNRIVVCWNRMKRCFWYTDTLLLRHKNGYSYLSLLKN